MVLFSRNGGTTRKRAETAFDSGADASVLLLVQTKLRGLLDRPLALSGREKAMAESS
jgi:hypothetical protein